MPRSILILLILSLSQNTFSSEKSRYLLCEGDITIALNLDKKTATVLQNSRSLTTETIRFNIYRCPDCYSAEGTYRYKGEIIRFSIMTKGNPLAWETKIKGVVHLSVKSQKRETSLYCNYTHLPQLAQED